MSRPNSDPSIIFILAVKALDFLNFYYLGGIIIVGVLGNGFQVVSFFFTWKKLTSPNYYLAALALVDFADLVVLFFRWFNQFKIDSFSGPILNEIFVYVNAYSSCSSAWIIVAFTCERLVVICFTSKRHKICTVRKAKIIIGCLFLATGIVQILSFYATGSTQPTLTTTTMEPPAGEQATHHNSSTSEKSLPDTITDSNWDLLPSKVMDIVIIVETAVTLVFPCVLTLIFNTLIIHGLFKFKKRFQSFLDQSTALHLKEEEVINVLFVLFCLVNSRFY